MGGDGCGGPDGYQGLGYQAQKTHPGPNSVPPLAPSRTHQEALYLNVRGPSLSLHFREEEAPWPREGKRLAQAHPGSLMAKPPFPNPLHILIPLSLVLIWQSTGVAALVPETEVGGNPRRGLLRSLSPSLSGTRSTSWSPEWDNGEKFGFGEQRPDQVALGKSLPSLFKPPFSQLLTEVVK